MREGDAPAGRDGEPVSEISARVERDSLSPEGVRLTTWVCRIPKFLLAQLNTHRALSRNAASSRAIPTAKLARQVGADPFIPVRWGKHKPGMGTDEELGPAAARRCRLWWLEAARHASQYAELMAGDQLAKETVNRLLEPFMWVDWVVSATDTANFFALRDHHEAQPEMQELAKAMRAALLASTPTVLSPGRWHLPFVEEGRAEGFSYRPGDPLPELLKVSAARCAWVSYSKHGKEARGDDYFRTFKKLAGSMPVHASPLEHQATPWPWGDYPPSNFRPPWLQLRKLIPGETVREGEK